MEAQRRLVIYGMWVLWMDRNKNLHEGKDFLGKEAARYVRHYLGELDSINERQISDAQQNEKWKAPPLQGGYGLRSGSYRLL